MNKLSKIEFAGEVANFLFRKTDNSGDQRNERVVFSSFYVFSGVKFGSALANENVSRLRQLSAKNFHAQILGFRVSS